MEDLKQKNLEDLGFEDAHYVHNVYYNSNSEIIRIELSHEINIDTHETYEYKEN